jgi:hypothetical protein
MKASAARGPGRRVRPGARVSAALQQWPVRNYFADLQPQPKEVHPIDALMDGHPEVRRISRRSRRLLARVQKHARADALLDFEAERNLLDWTRVEVAYNLGFEGGLVLGRAQALGRGSKRAGDHDEGLLLRELRAALASTRAAPERVEALLLELAWAFALGGGRSGGAEAIVPRRRT